MVRTLKFIGHSLLALTLTVLTQVGGIVYLVSLIFHYKYSLTRIKSIGGFAFIYLLTALVVLPLIAPLFGRVPLPVHGNLQPLNLLTCALNRHYVTPRAKEVLISLARLLEEEFPGNKINYLDANFPFLDGFPLIPHLSHNDGRKVDLAFLYQSTKQDREVDDAPSFIGYGIYDAPINGEINLAKECADKGFWQYGFLTYLVPKWNEENYVVDVERTSRLVRLLAETNAVSKIFIEPHLKQRWGLSKFEKIRFHGCQAVRHDDHIHFQTIH